MANTTGKKYGGRNKGTPNKLTTDIRQKFSLLVDKNLDRLQDDLDTLEPRDRLKIIIELSKFILPTLKATELHESKDIFQPIIINFDDTDK
ncbi:hypothetical protein N8258_01275 [Algibacter sp.]|nr:hypothetical protein [Algibacter sp.]MDA9069190.1 hypothetical protein [Algibacter sp.]MDC1365030.1 hypothetical protein [Algibacter sp.]